jgi:hypothetical protein
MVMAAVVGLAACGSSNKTPAGGGGGAGSGGGAGGAGGGVVDSNGDCIGDAMVTVSGAFTGTRSVPETAASWSSDTDQGKVLMDAQSGTPFLTGWSFMFPGKPMTTTYTDATTGLSCVVTLSDSTDPHSGWLAEQGVSGVTSQGTCSLTLTSVTAWLTASNQTQYCVHGTAQATMPAKPGSTSTGTVMHATSF